MRSFIQRFRGTYTEVMDSYWERKADKSVESEYILREKKFAYTPVITSNLQLLWLTEYWVIHQIFYFENGDHPNPYYAHRAELRVIKLNVGDYVAEKLKGELV